MTLKPALGGVRGRAGRAALRAGVVALVAVVLLAGTARPAAAQTMRALIVGVAEYSHWTMTNQGLGYPDDDAISMRDMLTLDPMWDPANITTLIDSQATKADIQSWMNYYASVTAPGDTFLFYYSGFGDYGPDVGPLEGDEDDGMDEYILPNDTDALDNTTMISDDELALWLADIHASQRIVIIDSAFSGGITKAASGGGKKGQPWATKTISQWTPDSPMDGDGFGEDLLQPLKPVAPGGEGSKDINNAYANTYVIMACNDLEGAAEDFYLGHGLMTYYVLEAGYSLHSDTNGNGMISAEEVFAYLEPWVISYWGGFGTGQIRQHPQAFDTNLGEINFMTAQAPRPTSVIMQDNLDVDPLWEVSPPDQAPTWEFGVPLGVGGQSGDPDPLTPHSWIPGAAEPSVYGFNLAGDYFSSMVVETTLTMPPVDLTGYWNARLQFWRWLGVEEVYWDEAAIQVSIDGTNWFDIWRNPGLSISDTQWMFCDIPLGTLADFQSEVYVRWTMGPTDFALTFCGWNIDDVQIVATPTRTLTLDDGTNIVSTTYDIGEVVTITCLPPAGWTLDEWVGDVAQVDDVSAMTTTVTMNGNYAVTAQLRDWFFLTVNNGTGSGQYPFNTLVPIISAAPLSQFVQWTGDIATVTDPLNPVTDILVDGDYTVTAQQTYSLSVINGTGGGMYNLGDVVPIVSTLPPGTFIQWAGQTATVADPFSPSTTITIIDNLVVTAQGTTQYTLTVNNGTGGGTYADGTTVNIDSTLPAGTFDHWAGDVGTVADVNSPSTTIVMTGNYTVTAVAALLPPDVDVTTEDGLGWVYQNTPLTLSNNGHKVRLQVNVLDLGSNTAVTVTVAKVPGSGPGQVTIQDDPGGDPLVKYISGSLRTDGLANCGDLTLEVIATGDVTGQDTVTLPFKVSPLGDIDGNGAVEPGDASLLVLKLNGAPPGGYHDKAFDLDANGAAEPGDMLILTNVLNDQPVP